MFEQMTKEQKKIYEAQLAEENTKFMALTHEVFKRDTKGAQWLEMATRSFLLLQPVANPQQDEKWAFFREGMNTFIRNIQNTVRLNEAEAKKEVAK